MEMLYAHWTAGINPRPRNSQSPAHTLEEIYGLFASTIVAKQNIADAFYFAEKTRT